MQTALPEWPFLESPEHVARCWVNSAAFGMLRIPAQNMLLSETMKQSGFKREVALAQEAPLPQALGQEPMRKAMTRAAATLRDCSPNPAKDRDPHMDKLPPSDDFWHGTVWPIPESALAALVDLGLSDECIARYFRVGLGNVQSLRLRYGMQPACW